MRRMIKVFVASSMLLGFLLGTAFGADPSHGQELAQRWCSGCHAVTINPKNATDIPPPFAVIAQRPDFDAGRLSYFLLDPHPVMPNMGLSRTEATDLAAYIASLRK